MKHAVEKCRVRFNGKIVSAEVYLLDGKPIEVFVEGIDAPIDARFVEILREDALDDVLPKGGGAKA
jgi:hypothetical protein